jgi:hypothetical protein
VSAEKLPWKVGEKRRRLAKRANESRGEALIHFAESSKGERTDEIFGGDFTKFREPLDLPEVRGSYSASVERF